ncbi:MAG: IS3 family transposase, partial [Bacteroidota bacterium]
MQYKLSKNRMIEVLPYSRSWLLGNSNKTKALEPRKADEELLVDEIKGIRAEHPFWGYRRIWAWLRYQMGYNRLNRKKVYRVMEKCGLLQEQTKKKAPRKPSGSKPKADRPNQWWGIDMTKVLVNNWGWVYVVVVMDWYTKKILGHYLGLQAKAKHWLEALNIAVENACPNGCRGMGIKLMSDHGSQPTATRFMRECGLLGIEQVFTSYNNPKGNADTERLIRTLKEEFFWRKDWDNLFELVAEFKKFVEEYHERYPHSTLDYLSPNEFERRWAEKQATSVPQDQFFEVDEGFDTWVNQDSRELALVG